MSDVGILDVDELRKKMGRLASFLNEMSPFSNAHAVDFITAERWKSLDPHLQIDLLNLPCDRSNSLVGDDFVTSERRKKYPHLCDFIDRAKNFWPEGLGICTNIEDVLPEFGKWRDSFETADLKNANWCVSEKKRHEVRKMASLISALNEVFPIDLVIDAGSGKGYLSSYVARFLCLDVVGIDECEKKCRSAVLRHEKISEMLRRRKKNPRSAETKEFVSIAKSIDRTSDLERIVEETLIDKDNVSEKREVSRTFDLSRRLGDDRSDNSPSVLLCGLHTCGNLTSDLIRQFVSCTSVKILCHVGCCYNLLTEEFCDGGRVEGGNSETGFPVSTFLREAKFSLGRNARLLASQCRERTIKNKDFHKPLFYRALLQVILADRLHWSDQSMPNLEFRVGRIAKNSQSFKDYASKALERLNLQEIKIDCKEIESYLHTYAAEEKKLKTFQLLRIILAPCIEALILLDRLLYLWEQEEVEEAYLARLFDSVVSPRCYVLIATKKRRRS